MLCTLMERSTGDISGIVCVSYLSDATEVLSTVFWRGLLSRNLSALIENVTAFLLLVTRPSTNEFVSLFLTACYEQALFIANRSGVG